MVHVTEEQAKANLSSLIDDALQGEEVMILREGAGTVRLSVVARVKRKAVFGSAKGLIKIHPGFDGPVDDFKEYV
jgi:antitoxin (DNA-binding transcriptional repressor) of toxin-antitoxin stability system